MPSFFFVCRNVFARRNALFGQNLRPARNNPKQPA
jgi:hypothetical protein